MDIKPSKPSKCVLSGEDKEIQVFKGPPYKLEKSIQKIHAGFVTKIAFTPWDEGAHFITVSQDKSLKVHNSETYETVLEHAGLHTMGINDFCFTENANEIVTCSSDRTVKVWRVNFETKALEEVRTLGLSEIDTEEFKDNVDKQILGLAWNNGQVMSVSCNTDINAWAADHNSPVSTIRGHANTINKVANFKGQWIASGDNDGRLLLWNPKTGIATRSSSLFKSKI